MKTKITSPLELFQKLQDDGVEVYYKNEKLVYMDDVIRLEDRPKNLDWLLSRFEFDKGFYTWQPKQKTPEQYESEIAELTSKVITREGFFEAWNKHRAQGGHVPAHISWFFNEICKELGL